MIYYFVQQSIKRIFLSMIELVIASLILLIGTGFYFLHYKPKRTIEKFALMARKAGYKVRLEPYTLLEFFIVKYIKQDNCSLQVYKKQLKEYDLIVGNLFTDMAILPNNLDILKDLYAQSRKLHKSNFFAVLCKLLGQGGIAFAEGNQWKRKRKIISSIFHFDFLNDMIPIIKSEIQTQFQRIDKKIEKGQKTINMKGCFSKILSSVIVKCFFGTDVNEYEVEGIPFYQFYLNFLSQIAIYSRSSSHLILGINSYKYGLTKEARSVKKNINILTTIVRQVIEKQLKKLKNNQFTHKNLLTTLYENNGFNQTGINDPNKYTIDELMGEFFSFFAAGTETTANTSNLILHYLSQMPQYIKKIDEELQEIKSLQGSEKLQKMKWIEAIFNESLRIGNPASALLPRVIAENITAGGLQIPAGTSLNFYPIANQFKDQYFDKPFDFMPQRWMNDQNIPNYAYIPFAAGQRNCIGQYLAKIQMKILISKTVEKYTFKAKYPIKMVCEFAYFTQYGEFQMEIKDSSN